MGAISMLLLMNIVEGLVNLGLESTICDMGLWRMDSEDLLAITSDVWFLYSLILVRLFIEVMNRVLAVDRHGTSNSSTIASDTSRQKFITYHIISNQ